MHKVPLWPLLHADLDIHAAPQQKACRQPAKSRRRMLFLTELPLIPINSDLHVTHGKLLESLRDALVSEREHSHIDAFPSLAKLLDVHLLQVFSGREVCLGSALG